MSYKVRTDEIGGVLNRLNKDRITAIKTKATVRAAFKAMPHVVKDTPVDRGNARAAWQVVPRPGLGADLINDAPYVGILELGSRPHTPPLMPILRWVVRKFGLDLNGGRRSFESIKDVPYPTYLAAKTVQENIARKGTKPHGMVTNNLATMGKILKKEVQRQVKAVQPR